MMRTLRYSRKFAESVVKPLGGTPHPLTKQTIFPTYRELMCFAAVLGFEHDAKLPLDEEREDFVDGRIFSNYSPAMDLFYLIALAGSKRMNILQDQSEEEAITIFEQYANGGLQVLADWLNAKPDDAEGDKAILAAFYRDGYLGPAAEKNSDEVASEVTF